MFLIQVSYTKQTHQKYQKATGLRAAVFNLHSAVQVGCEVELTVHGSES